MKPQNILLITGLLAFLSLVYSFRKEEAMHTSEAAKPSVGKEIRR
jgi:hypothetical protein